MDYHFKGCYPKHNESRHRENVLVLQGGGSLGAFACGVFKGLAKNNVALDIVAGTSIGAINAAIIAGSKNDYPERDLENFWLEIAESNIQLIPDVYLPRMGREIWDFKFQKESSGSLNATFFGIPKFFQPRWTRFDNSIEMFTPWNWTYIYDHSPLAKTIEKYIDFSKISPFSQKAKKMRLIVTAVDVITSEPLVFDSTKMEIKTKHLLASSGYPVYGFPWVEIEKGVYAWDGSLLSNTPVREVIDASPRNDKQIFIVENYPRHVDRMPASMSEVFDRTRDIIFSDKNMHTIRMSKLITRQIELIEKLYSLFEISHNENLTEQEIHDIKKEYRKLVANRGAEILCVIRIIKDNVDTPHLLKNADFSIRTVKKLIIEGENKAIDRLKQLESE